MRISKEWSSAAGKWHHWKRNWDGNIDSDLFRDGNIILWIFFTTLLCSEWPQKIYSWFEEIWFFAQRIINETVVCALVHTIDLPDETSNFLLCGNQIAADRHEDSILNLSFRLQWSLFTGFQNVFYYFVIRGVQRLMVDGCCLVYIGNTSNLDTTHYGGHCMKF